VPPRRWLFAAVEAILIYNIDDYIYPARKSMKTQRAGIISANWGAMAHLPAWRGVPGVEVTAICTSRRETAEERCWVRLTEVA
jgi:hypothetical protein